MDSTKEERTWALVAHLAAPVGYLGSGGLLGFVVPLVIWLVKRDESPFVADQAKEALNFTITIFILWVIGLLLVIVTLGLGLLVVIPGFFLLGILQVVLGILGGLRSYEGVLYRYPFSLRLV